MQFLWPMGLLALRAILGWGNRQAGQAGVLTAKMARGARARRNTPRYQRVQHIPRRHAPHASAHRRGCPPAIQWEHRQPEAQAPGAQTADILAPGTPDAAPSPIGPLHYPVHKTHALLRRGAARIGRGQCALSSN